MTEPTMVVPVRKYTCGNLDCETFAQVRGDIWPAVSSCCDAFAWPTIPCDGCDADMETTAERTEEVLYGWRPGIAQFGAGPLPSPG